VKFFQKILASLFLVALLFALSGKTIHVISESGHDHDFVCSENSTHFHEQEHTCFICDFELQTSDGFWPLIGELTIFATEFSKTSIFLSLDLVKQSFSFDARGPPVMMA
jgi:hypothetical protein